MAVPLLARAVRPVASAVQLYLFPPPPPLLASCSILLFIRSRKVEMLSIFFSTLWDPPMEAILVVRPSSF